LFPNEGAYSGNITAFTRAGAPTISGFVHTDFGGDIQLLTPGGGVTLGSEGLAAGADSGLVAQGDGNIQIYSKDSILLGLWRIMTKFGGNILAWSAGRAASTSSATRSAPSRVSKTLFELMA
jgi:hypothetical protein